MIIRSIADGGRGRPVARSRSVNDPRNALGTPPASRVVFDSCCDGEACLREADVVTAMGERITRTSMIGAGMASCVTDHKKSSADTRNSELCPLQSAVTLAMAAVSLFSTC